MGVGVKYTLGVDGQQGINTLDLFTQKFNLVGEAAKTVGSKIQTAMTFTAIEEAIRRTGEWAQNTDKLAISLGTTSEKVQALKQLALGANLDEDKVTVWFETLDEKRREAIKGNFDLIMSFQALGVSFKDLQHMDRADLIGKLMGNQNVGSLVAGTPMGNAFENILGANSIPSFQALQRASGGKSLNDFTQQQIDAGDIVPKKDVTELSNEWREVKQDLANALKELTPVGKILMSVATIISETVLGLARIVGNLGKIITGTLSGDFGKVGSGLKSIGSVLLNAVFGVVKIFTGLVDLVAKAANNLVKHIPFVGKFAADETINYTKYVQNAQDFYNKKLGSTRDDIRGGEGIGAAATIVATGGAGGVAETAETGLLRAAGTAEKLGALETADTLLTAAARAEKLKSLGLAKFGVPGQLASIALGSIGAANGTPTGNTTGFNGQVPGDVPFNGTVPFQQTLKFTGESASQLKIGGIFGTGIQTKMIRLAETQVNLLSEIVKNTSYLGKLGIVGPVTDNKKPAGGN
jgi:hypothetical protein